MMLDERVREALAGLVRPLVRVLVRAGVTPNVISSGACVVAVAAAALVAAGFP
jgi:hypothetical protein